MKKPTAIILALAFAACLFGCKKTPVEVTFYTTAPVGTTLGTTQPPTEETVPASSPDAAYTGNMFAVSLPVSIQLDQDDKGTQISRFESQYMTLVHPESTVADKIILDFQNRQDGFRSDAKNLLTQAENAFTGDKSWSPYFYAVTYEPARVDQTVLSLFGSKISWSGASHPERNCVFANYDMVTGDVLTLGSILVHEDQAAALNTLLITELDQIAQEQSLFPGYEATVSARFDQAISYDEGWYFSRDGLCFAFSPYEIAPYSQGIISVTIPYEKLTGIIVDSFFPPERDSGNGTISISWPTDEELSALSGLQIAETILDREGDMLLLKTDSLVYDVRLEMGQWNPDGSPAATCYTVFGTDTLSSQMAVMIQAQMNSSDVQLRLSYLQENETIYEYIAVVD